MRTNARLIQKNLFYKEKIFLLPVAWLLFSLPAKADECSLPETSAPYVERLSNRAACYKQQENYPLAEVDYQNVVEIVKQDKTISAQNLAIAQTNLGKLYSDWGNHPDMAEDLFENSIKMLESQPDPNTRIFEPMISLADLYLQQRQPEQAEKLYKRALGILRQAPADHARSLSIALNNLAQHYRLQNSDASYVEADKLFRESLALDEKNQPADLISIATSHYNLAHNYQDWGKLEEADKHYRLALELRQQILPPLHPDIARTQARLAELEEAKGNLLGALKLIDQAESSFHQYLPLHSSTDRSLSSQQSRDMQHFANLRLRLLQQSRQQGLGKDAEILPLAFQAIQEAHGVERMRLLLQAALRLASNSQGNSHDQIQQLWNLKHQREKLEKEYPLFLNEEASAPNKLEEWRKKISTIEADIHQLDAELRRTFPPYAQLINPEPISLKEACGLLQPGEALLVWAIDEDESHLMVVRPNQPPALYPLKIGRRDITAKVNLLTNQLSNATEYLQKHEQLPVFDLQTAHNLYQQLLAPAEDSLKGVQHIIAVTDGVLQRLPLSVLVKDEPSSGIEAGNEYHKADWLIKHYAFSYLPAVHSLADLRGKTATTPRTASNSAVRKPFIGFGDPLLGDALLQVSRLFTSRGLTATRGNIPDFITDPTSLKQHLPSLPDTAEELKYIAGLLGADQNKSLYLADRATETWVKQLSRAGELRHYRTISFATHALMPGKSDGLDLPWLEEPGLVLTPPAQGTEADDGFLSASEAATLDLDADWVLLSACNTGTPDKNTSGDGALSELAKSFFTAGSRSVLASHWSVDSASTKQLMTNMFTKLQTDNTMPRAEALRLAMQDIANSPPECGLLCQIRRQSPTQPAHPVYWAPFVVYGEGAAPSH